MTVRLRSWSRSLLRRAVRPFAGILHDEMEIVAKERRRHRDRRLRQALQSCGDDVRFGRRVRISDPGSACIGSGVRIEDDVSLEAEGGLTLGHGTFVGRGVTIRSASRDPVAAVPRRPVLVGREVWIGPGARIEPGSRIGDGAVVGAGALVDGAVEAGGVVVGPPPPAGERLGPDEPLARGRAATTRILFVPSTGRSGTTTVSRLLSRHPRIVCRHEARPQLIRLSTELAHGVVDEAAARGELDAIYRLSSVYPAPVYGESDHRLFNLVGMLAELLPSCRVLWLIRDGREVVASTFARGWYGAEFQSGVWGRYRLRGDRCGDVPSDQWVAMTPFEKNCWYWAYVNRVIERQLQDVASDRWRRLRLGDLGAEVPALLEFIGVEPVPIRVPHANPSTNAVVPHEAWDPERKEAFERQCGDLMDRWYPEWRERW